MRSRPLTGAGIRSTWTSLVRERRPAWSIRCSCGRFPGFPNGSPAMSNPPSPVQRYQPHKPQGRPHIGSGWILRGGGAWHTDPPRTSTNGFLGSSAPALERAGAITRALQRLGRSGRAGSPEGRSPAQGRREKAPRSGLACCVCCMRACRRGDGGDGAGP